MAAEAEWAGKRRGLTGLAGLRAPRTLRAMAALGADGLGGSEGTGRAAGVLRLWRVC